jgi:hypothetical protein
MVLVNKNAGEDARLVLKSRMFLFFFFFLTCGLAWVEVVSDTVMVVDTEYAGEDYRETKFRDLFLRFVSW